MASRLEEIPDVNGNNLRSDVPIPPKMLKESMVVVILGIRYRVHRITHAGKKIQLRRISK